MRQKVKHQADKRGREKDDQGDGEREEREKQRQAISYLESMDDSEELLDGILMELREQAIEEVRVKSEPMPVCEDSSFDPDVFEYGEWDFIDDISGKVLDSKLVRDARALES